MRCLPEAISNSMTACSVQMRPCPSSSKLLPRYLPGRPSRALTCSNWANVPSRLFKRSSPLSVETHRRSWRSNNRPRTLSEISPSGRFGSEGMRIRPRRLGSCSHKPLSVPIQTRPCASSAKALTVVSTALPCSSASVSKRTGGAGCLESDVGGLFGC